MAGSPYGTSSPRSPALTSEVVMPISGGASTRPRLALGERLVHSRRSPRRGGRLYARSARLGRASPGGEAAIGGQAAERPRLELADRLLGAPELAGRVAYGARRPAAGPEPQPDH